MEGLLLDHSDEPKIPIRAQNNSLDDRQIKAGPVGRLLQRPGLPAQQSDDTVSALGWSMPVVAIGGGERGESERKSPGRIRKYFPKVDTPVVARKTRPPMSESESQQLYVRASELMLLLSRLCRQSRSFGGSLSSHVEQPALSLVRVLGAVRATLVTRVIDSKDEVAVEWLEELEARATIAGACIRSLAESGAITRAMRRQYYERQLDAACDAITESLVQLVKIMKRHFTREQLKSINRIIQSVQTYYGRQEHQRELRVRDYTEVQLAMAMDKHITELHRLVLSRSKLNRNAHELQQEHCRDFFHRISALGVDQPRAIKRGRLEVYEQGTSPHSETGTNISTISNIRKGNCNSSGWVACSAIASVSACLSNSAIQRGEHRPKSGVRLEPLLHSPRLVDRKQANVDRGLQAEIQRYQTLPLDPMLHFSLLSNQSYSDAGIERNIDISYGSEIPLAVDVKEDPEARGSLSAHKRFDDFWESDTRANDLQQLKVVRAIGALCCKSVKDTVAELQSITTNLGFETNGLERVASLEQAADKKLAVAFLRPVDSSENTIVSLGTVPTRGRWNQGGNDFEEEEGEDLSDPVTASGYKKCALSWETLTERVCQALRIKSFEELRHRDSGRRVAKPEEIRTGQVIMVNAVRDTCYAALQTNVCNGDIDAVLDKLALHMDDPVVAADCCRAATALVKSDDYQGSADALRLKLIKFGGLGVLLVIAGREVPDAARGLTNEAANTLIAKNNHMNSEYSSMNNKYGEQAYMDASAAALQTLASIAKWSREETRLELLDARAAHTALDVIKNNVKQPQLVRYACELLTSIAETETGRDALGKLEAPKILPLFMIKCPVKRSFHPAQFAACNALANLLLDSPANASQLAALEEDAGLHYLCDVVTCVPGNVKVYTMACAALGRLAVFEPQCFTASKNKGLSTLLHALSRFPEFESIQCHVLAALSACFKRHPKIIKEFVLEDAFDKLRVSLTLFMEKPWADVQWRALMALSELVRRRRFVHESIHDGMLGSELFEKTALILKRAIYASSSDAKLQAAKIQTRRRLLGQEEENEAVNGSSLTWACIFMRYLLRSCCTLKFSGVADDGEGAHVDDTDADVEYSSDIEKPKFDDDAEILRARLAVARENVKSATDAAESITHKKGESLAAFLKHQAVADAITKDKQSKLEALEQETRLPPLGLRNGWARVFKRLHKLAFPKLLADFLNIVSSDPVLARECLRTLLVWLELQPEKLWHLVPKLIRGATKTLHDCAQSRSTVEYAVEVLHMLAHDLYGELEIGKEKQRLAAAAATTARLDELHNRKGIAQDEQQRAKAVQKQTATATAEAIVECNDSLNFAEDSVFASIFKAKSEPDRLIFIAETASAAMLRGSPQRAEWAMRALSALNDEKALDGIDAAIKRFAGSPTLSATLACLRDTTVDVLLILDEAKAFEIQERIEMEETPTATNANTF